MTTDLELLTTEQAAAYTGYSFSWLMKLRQNGTGPMSWKQGKRVVWPKSGLDLWLARLRETTRRGGDL